MRTRTPFEFKQFSVFQDRCAMKVGTDGVLLGAWAPIENDPKSILDIGTGTGLIALMLAQRCSDAEIDALELEDTAFEQAVENFEESDWGDRLFCYHASFQEYFQEIDQGYDLIVSNPPFYNATTMKAENASRALARYEDALPFEHLIEGVAKLLNPKGIFAVIVPYQEQERFCELSKESNLFPTKITAVKGTINSDVKRSLIAFSFGAQTTCFDTLSIEKSLRHSYTPAYSELTKAFYLKM